MHHHGEPMNSMKRLALIVPLCLILALATGCVRFWAWIDNCASFPRGAVPRPNGAALHETFANQAVKAEPEDFVIHEYEWRLGTSELDLSGYAHLDHLSKQLATTWLPIVIARSCDPALDEARRMAVVVYLTSKLAPPNAVELEPPELVPPASSERSVAEVRLSDMPRVQGIAAGLPLDEAALAQRVVVGSPYAEGLQGQEALQIAPGAVGAFSRAGGAQIRSGAGGFSGAPTNVGTFNFR
jgi:hypothetical protein